MAKQFEEMVNQLKEKYGNAIKVDKQLVLHLQLQGPAHSSFI